MSVVIVTGSAGLVGSEAVTWFAGRGLDVVGLDNDMRRVFFGDEASTQWMSRRLAEQVPRYNHHDIDVRDADAVDRIFRRYGTDVSLVIHAAAQPSHDWAAVEPLTDFSVNATGTLVLLEATRRHAPDSVFIYTSTNKVYGDSPNALPLVEQATRWEIETGHRYADGIAEDMSIDQSMHSLFGTSKTAADLMVQEYGRYFGMRTACFRGGCLTGPNHAGTRLHGFLAYLMRCAMTGTPYTVYGYKAKQVRDNIHSADLIAAFDAFFLAPRAGEVYNIGGGRKCNCSVAEAIALAEEIVGRGMEWTYSDEHRKGDHIWWISDVGRFRAHYPDWSIRTDVRAILSDIHAFNRERWRPSRRA